MMIVACLILLFCLTGCGADVSSETKFKKDGSGMRTVSAVISEDDAKNLDGGFATLDQYLEEAAPQGVNLERIMLENGDAKYQFIFYFKNIDDYNQKISEITGKSHEATWFTDKSIFVSDIQFREDDCTYDLIKWAIDAFKESEYASFLSNFTLYKVVNNKVYYEDELMFEGTGSQEFKKESAVSVKKTSLYSDYYKDGTLKKRLVLQFVHGGLEQIDLNQAKELLNQYTTCYKFDLANDLITFEFNQQEFYDFIGKVDPTSKDRSLFYDCIYNPFQKRYEIQESYNLKNFFLNFQLDYPYIYEYVNIPEEIDNQKYVHTNQIEDIPKEDGYTYQSGFRYDTDYSLSYYANKIVNVENISVNYVLKDDLSGEKRVVVTMTKNDCDLKESNLMEYFPHMKQTITVSDHNDTIAICFLTKIKEGMKQGDSNTNLSFEKLMRQNLKEDRWSLNDSISIKYYLPQIEGYHWKLDQIPISIKLAIAKESGVMNLSVNGQGYSFTSESNEVKLEDGMYLFNMNTTADQTTELQMTFEQINTMFYFWIAFGIFVVIAIILVFILVKLRQGGLNETEFGSELDVELDDTKDLKI